VWRCTSILHMGLYEACMENFYYELELVGSPAAHTTASCVKELHDSPE